MLTSGIKTTHRQNLQHNNQNQYLKKTETFTRQRHKENHVTSSRLMPEVFKKNI